MTSFFGVGYFFVWEGNGDASPAQVYFDRLRDLRESQDGKIAAYPSLKQTGPCPMAIVMRWERSVELNDLWRQHDERQNGKYRFSPNHSIRQLRTAVRDAA